VQSVFRLIENSLGVSLESFVVVFGFDLIANDICETLVSQTQKLPFRLFHQLGQAEVRLVRSACTAAHSPSLPRSRRDSAVRAPCHPLCSSLRLLGQIYRLISIGYPLSTINYQLSALAEMVSGL